MWVRLSERDEVDMSRGDKALYLGRRQSWSFGGQPSEDAWRVGLLRQRYPFYELRDVSPLLDRLRVVKSAREIEALRRNAGISAEGMRRAIALTRAYLAGSPRRRPLPRSIAIPTQYAPRTNSALETTRIG